MMLLPRADMSIPNDEILPVEPLYGKIYLYSRTKCLFKEFIPDDTLIIDLREDIWRQLALVNGSDDPTISNTYQQLLSIVRTRDITIIVENYPGGLLPRVQATPIMLEKFLTCKTAYDMVCVVLGESAARTYRFRWPAECDEPLRNSPTPSAYHLAARLLHDLKLCV